MTRAKGYRGFPNSRCDFCNLPEPSKPRGTMRSTRSIACISRLLRSLEVRGREPCGNPEFLCSQVLTFRTVLAIVAKLFGSHSAGQGGRSSLTTDTMCQNPFETIRPYSSPNG